MVDVANSEAAKRAWRTRLERTGASKLTAEEKREKRRLYLKDYYARQDVRARYAKQNSERGRKWYLKNREMVLARERARRARRRQLCSHTAE